jgi:NAD(P)-dependent dehydrogenase (short-subunit alcohol dehydrogenase family)
MICLGASQIILACRNIEKSKAAVKDIQTTTSYSPEALQVWPLDLSSYAAVLAFADRVKADLPRLDAVIANAGVGTMKFKMTENNEETITNKRCINSSSRLSPPPSQRDSQEIRHSNTFHRNSIGALVH